MAGSRKFAVECILAALTREAAVVSGNPYVMDVDMGAAERILDG